VAKPPVWLVEFRLAPKIRRRCRAAGSALAEMAPAAKSFACAKAADGAEAFRVGVRG